MNFEEKIESIKKCLELGLYYPALITALILPDKCGKYSENYAKCKKPRDKYIAWCNDFLCHEDPEFEGCYPKYDGDCIYKLRNALIHEFRLDSESDPLSNKFYEYEFVINGCCRIGTLTCGEDVKEFIRIDIPQFCEIITAAALAFYKISDQKIKDLLDNDMEIIDSQKRYEDLLNKIGGKNRK